MTYSFANSNVVRRSASLMAWDALPSRILGAMLLAYAAPGWIAISRRHPHAAAICIMDLLFGWTVIGWIAALVWSLRPSHEESGLVVNTTVPPSQMRPMGICTSCLETIHLDARKCPNCGKRVD